MPVSRATFLLALTVATCLRVAALPLPGTEDTGVWKVWSYAASADLLGVYGIGGNPPERAVLHFREHYTTVDYPPLALDELALLGRAYRAVLPAYPDDWRLSVAVKLPGLVAGVLLTSVIYAGVRRLTGEVALARWAAVACWCNPALILNGEVLGYVDPLVLAPLVAALFALHLDAPIWAGALYAAALLTKPQAALAAPAVLFAAWHTGGARRVLVTGAAGAAWLLVGVLPYLLIGAGPNMLLAFGGWQGRRDILSGDAANLWWVATWLARGYNMIPLFGFPGAYFQPVARILAISSWQEMGLPDPRLPSQVATLCAVAWAMWRTVRSAAAAVHFALAAFVVQAFFTLAVSVHEHHLITAVPMLAVAGALDRRFRPVFYAVSVVTALNMNLFYGISRGWGWAVPRTITPIDLSVLLAMVSVGVFVWHARVLVRVASGVAAGTSAAAVRTVATVA